MKKHNDSKSLIEVSEWKQKAYEELQNVPREKWMEFIREKTQRFVDEIMKGKKSKK